VKGVLSVLCSGQAGVACGQERLQPGRGGVLRRRHLAHMVRPRPHRRWAHPAEGTSSKCLFCETVQMNYKFSKWIFNVYFVDLWAYLILKCMTQASGNIKLWNGLFNLSMKFSDRQILLSKQYFNRKLSFGESCFLLEMHTKTQLSERTMATFVPLCCGCNVANGYRLVRRSSTDWFMSSDQFSVCLTLPSTCSAITTRSSLPTRKLICNHRILLVYFTFYLQENKDTQVMRCWCVVVKYSHLGPIYNKETRTHMRNDMILFFLLYHLLTFNFITCINKLRTICA